MVSLLEHAGESRTPAATAWLLVGSIAIALGSVSLACTALSPDEFPEGMVRYIAPSFAAAAAAIVVIGLVRPAPLIMVSAISAVLLLVWLALLASSSHSEGTLTSPTTSSGTTEDIKQPTRETHHSTAGPRACMVSTQRNTRRFRMLQPDLKRVVLGRQAWRGAP